LKCTAYFETIETTKSITRNTTETDEVDTAPHTLLIHERKNDMKSSVLRMASQRFMSTAAIAAFVIPASIGLSGVAQAAECAPLQVSGFQIVSPKKILQGNRPVGVEFYVRTTIKNTNANLHVSFHRNTMASLSAQKFYAKPGERNSVSLGTHNFSTHLRPGYSRAFISEKVTVMRDPNKLTELFVATKGTVYNAQCPPDRRVSTSDFKFDLLPVLVGGQARRVSGRIRGYSEKSRPRPRAQSGSGVPRPRS
jgi:hypothetical protein